MSKKLMALLLTAVMVFALAACAAPSQEPSQSPSTGGGTAPLPSPELTTAGSDAPGTGAGSGDAGAADPDDDSWQTVYGDAFAEPYELTYYMYSIKSSDQDKVVEAALNEIIGHKFNASVDFIMIAGGDWNDKAIVPLRAGEKIDIIFVSESRHHMANILNGNLLPLNDDNGPFGNLFDQYLSKTVEDLGWFITANVINGFNWAIPTNKELCVPGGLIWNEEYVEKYGVDITTVTTPEDLEPWLEKFKENEDSGVYPLLSTTGWSYCSPYAQTLSNMAPIGWRIGGEGVDTNPENIWLSEELRNYCFKQEEFMKKGYIHPDAGLKSFLNTDYINSGQFFVTTDHILKGGQVKAKELMGSSGNPDLRLVEYQTTESFIITGHAAGSMLGIPSTSKDARRAALYINEMHQNEDLINLMAWGIEGTHYDLNESGYVLPRSMNGWSDSHGGMWTIGCQFKQKIAATEDPEKYNQMRDLTAIAWPHCSLGFRFDQTGYDNEYAAIYNANDQYERMLRSGTNVSEDYDKFLKALEDAGIDTVLAAVQEQWETWLSMR